MFWCFILLHAIFVARLVQQCGTKVWCLTSIIPAGTHTGRQTRQQRPLASRLSTRSQRRYTAVDSDAPPMRAITGPAQDPPSARPAREARRATVTPRRGKAVPVLRQQGPAALTRRAGARRRHGPAQAQGPQNNAAKGARGPTEGTPSPSGPWCGASLTSEASHYNICRSFL